MSRTPFEVLHESPDVTVQQGMKVLPLNSEQGDASEGMSGLLEPSFNEGLSLPVRRVHLRTPDFGNGHPGAVFAAKYSRRINEIAALDVARKLRVGTR